MTQCYTGMIMIEIPVFITTIVIAGSNGKETDIVMVTLFYVDIRMTTYLSLGLFVTY